MEAHAFLHPGRWRRPIVLRENAKQEMLGPDVVVQEAIRFLFHANCRTRLVSALNRISTDVNTFSRKTGMTFDFLADVFEREVQGAKIRLVRPLPLRESGLEADARSQSRCFRAGWLHTGQAGTAALFPCALEHLVFIMRYARLSRNKATSELWIASDSTRRIEQRT